MKAKEQRVPILLISRDPILANHFFTLYDKFVAQSSLQAATMIRPSGIAVLIKTSRELDEV